MHEFQKSYFGSCVVGLKIVHDLQAMYAFFFSVGEMKLKFESDYYFDIFLKRIEFKRNVENVAGIANAKNA